MSPGPNGWQDEREDEREALAFADPDAWRGDQHPEDWPENLAGPEYWLFKAAAQREAEHGPGRSG